MFLIDAALFHPLIGQFYDRSALSEMSDIAVQDRHGPAIFIKDLSELEMDSDISVLSAIGASEPSYYVISDHLAEAGCFGVLDMSNREKSLAALIGAMSPKFSQRKYLFDGTDVFLIPMSLRDVIVVNHDDKVLRFSGIPLRDSG